MTTKEALDHLRQAWKDDPGYRLSWTANIAMAFYDEAMSSPLIVGRNSTDIHPVCTRAAERFMQQLEQP